MSKKERGKGTEEEREEQERKGVRKDRKKEGKKKQNLRLGTPEKERVIRFLFCIL